MSCELSFMLKLWIECIDMFVIISWYTINYTRTRFRLFYVHNNKYSQTPEINNSSVTPSMYLQLTHSDKSFSLIVYYTLVPSFGTVCYWRLSCQIIYHLSCQILYHYLRWMKIITKNVNFVLIFHFIKFDLSFVSDSINPTALIPQWTE